MGLATWDLYSYLGLRTRTEIIIVARRLRLEAELEPAFGLVVDLLDHGKPLLLGDVVHRHVGFLAMRLPIHLDRERQRDRDSERKSRESDICVTLPCFSWYL